MVNIPLVFFWKIGISNSTRAHRADQVSKSAPGRAVVVWVWDIPNAHRVEQFLHAICAPFNLKYYRGDGATEWFLFPAAIIAAAIMIVWHIVVYSLIFACGVYAWYLMAH